MTGRLGLLGIVGGIAVLVLTNRSDSTTVNDVGAIVGVVLFLLGLVVWALGRTGFRRWRRRVLREGLEGIGEVLEMRDTGSTVGTSPVLRLKLLVTVPDRAPYEAETTAVVSRAQLGALQPGAVLSVKVDPDRPERVVVDRGRHPEIDSAESEVPGGEAPGMTVAGRPISESFTAADIIARGVATTGELGQVVPTGMTAGQVVPNLAPHEADDPLVTMSFTYQGPSADTLHKEAMMRVPDGKAALLVTGSQIPVRYLPDRPDVATIDWDRL
jgi:hypothetical protein